MRHMPDYDHWITIVPRLNREQWTAEGRSDALRFVLEQDGDLAKISEKQQEIMELIADPVFLAGPMAPNAGPRIYREGYLDGLRFAIDLLTSGQS